MPLADIRAIGIEILCQCHSSLPVARTVCAIGTIDANGILLLAIGALTWCLFEFITNHIYIYIYIYFSCSTSMAYGRHTSTRS